VNNICKKPKRQLSAETKTPSLSGYRWFNLAGCIAFPTVQRMPSTNHGIMLPLSMYLGVLPCRCSSKPPRSKLLFSYPNRRRDRRSNFDDNEAMEYEVDRFTSTLDGILGQEIAYDERGAAEGSASFFRGRLICLHLMIISPNSKRETTLNSGIARSLFLWVFQRATGNDSLLRRIKGYNSKFLPIIDEWIFGQYVVDCDLALWRLYRVSMGGRANRKKAVVSGQHTSLNFSIGTWISSAISLLPLKISPVRLQQHAGMAILAKTRSYSIRLRSNHIST